MSDERTDTDAQPATQRRRRKKRFIAILILLVGVVTLVSGELVVRVYVHQRGWTPNCYAGSVDLFQPHPATGYVLRPGFRLRSGVWKIRISQAGFRGPEIRRSKPPGTKRIAILGGSSVFGYLVSDGQEAARLLEAKLNSTDRQSPQFEVINGGVPGHNLNQTVWRFENQIRAFSPDLVILYLGWNDLGYIVSDNPTARPFHRRPVASALTRMASRSTLYGLIVHRLIGGAASLSAESLSATEPSEPGEELFRSNLARLISSAKARGCRIVVCAQVTAAHPDSDESIRAFLGSDLKTQNRMIQLGEWQRIALQEEASRAEVTFVDLNRVISPSSDNLRDYVHLSETGERQLASELAKIVQQQFEL